MSLEQTNVIDPYIPWTGWGDYAFNDDVNAISEYIENQRPHIKEHPDLQAVIEQYESWLTGLSWFEKYMTPDASVSKAVYYRDKVNDILGTKVDPSTVPGDTYKKIIPIDPSKAESPLDTFIHQFIPSSVSGAIKKVLYGTIIIVTGGTIIYLFGPAIRRVVTAKAEQKYFTRNDIIKKEEDHEQF